MYFKSKYKLFFTGLFILFLVGYTRPTKSSECGIKLIEWYQKNLATLNFTQCQYYPTCSNYTKESIEKHGLIKGCVCGFDRLMRCNNDLWVYQEVLVDGKLKKYDPAL